jgi:hypothetical protein
MWIYENGGPRRAMSTYRSAKSQSGTYLFPLRLSRYRIVVVGTSGLRINGRFPGMRCRWWRANFRTLGTLEIHSPGLRRQRTCSGITAGLPLVGVYHPVFTSEFATRVFPKAQIAEQ